MAFPSNIILPRSNKLAFPTGVAPGFDPSHPAAVNVVLSNVSNGRSNIDLRTGVIGAKYVSNGNVLPTAALIGTLGPCEDYSAGGATKLTVPAVAPAAVTIAAFVQLKTTPASANCLFTTSDNLASVWLFHSYSSTLYFSPVTGSYSLGALANNVPYFVVVSAVSASAIQYAVTRLDTGSIVSGTIANSTAFGVSNGIAVKGYQVINGSSQYPGYIGPMMYSNAALSLQQVRAWAADPWSFWYPRRMPIVLVGSSVSFLSAWAMNTNSPVLGTGTY